MDLVYLAVPITVWLASALSDLTSFRIPNRYTVALVVAWPIAAALAVLPVEAAGSCLLIAAALLVAGFGLFAAKLLGAGDAKLIAASGLWLGPDAVLPFILYTTLAGAALSLLLLRLRTVPLPVAANRYPWLVDLHERRKAVPYAVAIATGALVSLPQSVFVS
ncbi:A24 family peptidase [Parvularcula oceani]|uniref:A24 family peptidase n=1 Tax=Parvularcula oceani TaxID=1247963 RepID=UPI00056488AE|nr:prepilin peptidase [Parvularcula oceani]